MDIGQRIKQARLEAGLSQRQLCGDTITRNMLSLIESGKARPGMDTLAFLASRLGKPMGWFLEEQAVLSPNQSLMEQARLAWENREPEAVIAALEGYRAPDPVFDGERFLLEALCRLDMARQAISQQRRLYARELLEAVRLAGEKTPYYTPELERRRLLLGAMAEPDGPWAAHLPCPDEELTALAHRAFRLGQLQRCVALLEAVERRDEAWFLLRGRCALELGQPAQAAEFLHRAEQALPQECFALLERCYRDMEDFKMAYTYALKQRNG